MFWVYLKFVTYRFVKFAYLNLLGTDIDSFPVNILFAPILSSGVFKILEDVFKTFFEEVLTTSSA